MKKIKIVKLVKKPRLLKGLLMESSFHQYMVGIHALCKGISWGEAFNLTHDWMGSAMEQEFVD